MPFVALEATISGLLSAALSAGSDIRSNWVITIVRPWLVCPGPLSIVRSYDRLILSTRRNKCRMLVLVCNLVKWVRRNVLQLVPGCRCNLSKCNVGSWLSNVPVVDWVPLLVSLSVLR